jgi:hypothetical protein
MGVKVIFGCANPFARAVGGKQAMRASLRKKSHITAARRRRTNRVLPSGEKET